MRKMSPIFTKFAKFVKTFFPTLLQSTYIYFYDLFVKSSKVVDDYNPNWHLATVAMDDVTRS